MYFFRFEDEKNVQLARPATCKKHKQTRGFSTTSQENVNCRF